jgi:hypothetical protein
LAATFTSQWSGQRQTFFVERGISTAIILSR